MERENFISKYGNEEVKVTDNFITKAIGSKYDVKDAFNEFVDNAFDARVNNEVTISFTDDSNAFIFLDNGSGIKNWDNVFTLGASTKEILDAIGKYGIGLKGAVSAIATRCRIVKDLAVECIIESCHNGGYGEKHILVEADGRMVIGRTEKSECNKNLHYTKISFSNVSLAEHSFVDVIESLKKTFEQTFPKGLTIMFNNKKIIPNTPTFYGDERVKHIKVGEHMVEVKYRIIGGEDSNPDARAFEEAGLRIYDKESGRLLGMDNKYWKWFIGKEAQQNICGLRCAVYIESNISCYKTFGINPEKNGVSYHKYINEPEFAELAEELKEIYYKSQHHKVKDDDKDIYKISRISFEKTSRPMKNLYEVISDNYVQIKKKYTYEDVLNLVYENLMMKKKVSK